METPCGAGKNGQFTGLDWFEQLMPYVKNTGVFPCPSAQQTSTWKANFIPDFIISRISSATDDSFVRRIVNNWWALTMQ
jgi:hypothetical protein